MRMASGGRRAARRGASHWAGFPMHALCDTRSFAPCAIRVRSSVRSFLPDFEQNNMLTALEETSPGWDPAGSRQLSGMLLLVFVRKKIASQLGACLSAATPCGIMGVGGNKGAVGIRVSLFRRIISCVNCHLAAHQGAVAKRNRNYETVMESMSFFPASANDYWRKPAKAAVAVMAAAPSQATISGDDDEARRDSPSLPRPSTILTMKLRDSLEVILLPSKCTPPHTSYPRRMSPTKLPPHQQQQQAQAAPTAPPQAVPTESSPRRP